MIFFFLFVARTAVPRRAGWQKSSFCRKALAKERKGARRVFLEHGLVFAFMHFSAVSRSVRECGRGRTGRLNFSRWGRRIFGRRRPAASWSACAIAAGLHWIPPQRVFRQPF